MAATEHGKRWEKARDKVVNIEERFKSDYSHPLARIGVRTGMNKTISNLLFGTTVGAAHPQFQREVARERGHSDTYYTKWSLGMAGVWGYLWAKGSLEALQDNGYDMLMAASQVSTDLYHAMGTVLESLTGEPITDVAGVAAAAMFLSQLTHIPRIFRLFRGDPTEDYSGWQAGMNISHRSVRAYNQSEKVRPAVESALGPARDWSKEYIAPELDRIVVPVKQSISSAFKGVRNQDTTAVPQWVPSSLQAKYVSVKQKGHPVPRLAKTTDRVKESFSTPGRMGYDLTMEYQKIASSGLNTII